MSIIGYVGQDGYRYGFKIGSNDSSSSFPFQTRQVGYYGGVVPVAVVTPFGVFQSQQIQPCPTAVIINNPTRVHIHHDQQDLHRVLSSLSSLSLTDEDIPKPIIIGGKIKHYVMVSKKSKPVYDRDGDLIDYK